MHARCGTPQAMTATAPPRARVIDTRLTPGTASVRQRRADDAQPDQDRRLQHGTRRAKALGDALVNTPTGAPLSCARPRSSALEGPRLSRVKSIPSADICFFPRLFDVGIVGNRQRVLT
jgi:hypothetical protein